MYIIFYILFFCLTAHYGYSQVTGTKSLHGLTDSLEINMDAVNDIDFSVSFSNDHSFEDIFSESKYLGVESLPKYYIKEEYIGVTLTPYNSSTKYDEDPIKGMGMMMTDSFGKEYSTKINMKLFPSGTGKPKVAPTGISFSLEDALLSIFSKSYRARKYNARHATGWKNY